MNRWRVEYALTGVFVAFAALTAAAPQWIELVFKVDPDAGSGALEWVLVAVFAVAAVIAALYGMRDHRQVAAIHQ